MEPFKTSVENLIAPVAVLVIRISASCKKRYELNELSSRTSMKETHLVNPPFMKA